MFWIILGIIVVVYLVILVIVFAMQERMVFYPTSAIEATPATIGLAYDDVSFKTEDGVLLNGWFIPADSAIATLIFCHGNGGNISHRLASIEQFHALNVSVFIFDYRGYGKSEGKLSEDGTYLDAAAAWTYVTEQRGVLPQNIIIFGRSLGGGIASWLAQNRPAKALILESTFTSIPDIASRHYPFLPVKLLARYHYNSLERVKEITIPKLFIHSREDTLVPFALGWKLFEGAVEPKQFLEIYGGHNEGYTQSHDRYLKEVGEFIHSCFGK